MNSLWQVFVLIAMTNLAVSNQENQQTCSEGNFNEKKIYETVVRAEQKVEEMEKKLEAALETVLSVLYYRKEEMDSKFEQLSKSISENLTDSFTSKVNDKVSLLSDLEERLANKSEKLTESLTSKVNDKVSLLSDLEGRLANKSATLDEYIREHLDFSEKLRELRLYIDSMSSPTVAFSATTPAVTSLNVNQVIVMTDVQLNEGAGYNGSTGEFTVPENGLYLFHAELCGQYRKWIFISIDVDTKSITKGAFFEHDSDSCTSFSAIARVKKGQKVLFRSTSITTLLTDSVRQCSVFGYRLGN